VKKRMLGVAAAALLVTGGAVAVANAAHGQVVKRHLVRQLVRGGVHADVSLTRANGTTDAFSVDRGKVTAASSTSLSLLRRDGKTVTVTLNGSTIVRGTPTTGKSALVFSRSGAAFRVLAPGFRKAPKAPKQAAKSPIVHLQVSFVRADGSTHTAGLDRGLVTATSGTSLTIKEANGQIVAFSIAGAKVNGKLVVGGKALVVSRDGKVTRVLAGAA
jgi:hypothetical protein